MKGWIFLLLLLLSASAQANLHCGNRLVNRGDPQYHVAEYCPEPFWVERWEAPLDHQYHYSGPYGGRAFGGVRFEAWYINFGSNKLMRRLVFRNGYLESTESLGRGVGFRPGSRRCSSRELRLAGNSAGEVYANCGTPDYIYDEPVAFVQQRHNGAFLNGGHFVYRTRWVYDFGSRRFDAELIFQDGRLIRINDFRP